MIVLIGFMGAGKTTVGRALAKLVGLPFVDTDEVIESRSESSISDIFASQGESGFRMLERTVVLDVLDGPDSVVALGGGAVTNPDVQTALGWANVVYLETGVDEIVARVGASQERPLMTERNPRELLEERVPLYEKMADTTVRTDGRTPEQVAEEIAAALMTGDATGTDTIRVALGERSYLVFVGDALSARVGSLVPGPIKAFVITHPSLRSRADVVVASLETAGNRTHVLEVPEGEGSKSLDEAGRLLGEMAAAEAHRADLVVTFGGGVISDLGGFVASTYARGVGVVHVPTTLLGQVDAAIGGKTGVNLPQGKNLVGTFHQPLLVVCDLDLLKDLPGEEFVSGLAEVVKYGLIADTSILDTVYEKGRLLAARDQGLLRHLVTASVQVKADVVAADERESGMRAVLNYGHTFAHAIEATQGYGAIRHGEAVALGMMAAAYLAGELGMLDADAIEVHRRTLAAAGLPTEARLSYAELEPAWRLDKKFDSGVRFVLLEAIGQPVVGVTADPAAVARSLERMNP